jgi:hypothetical protein
MTSGNSLPAPHLSNYSGAAGGRSFPLQAHHLDLEFYNNFYKPGSYLRSHAHHMARWHGTEVHGALE